MQVFGLTSTRCFCKYEFCYFCGKQWKTCGCSFADEDNLYERDAWTSQSKGVLQVCLGASRVRYDWPSGRLFWIQSKCSWNGRVDYVVYTVVFEWSAFFPVKNEAFFDIWRSTNWWFWCIFLISKHSSKSNRPSRTRHAFSHHNYIVISKDIHRKVSCINRFYQ